MVLSPFGLSARPLSLHLLSSLICCIACKHGVYWVWICIYIGPVYSSSAVWLSFYSDKKKQKIQLDNIHTKTILSKHLRFLSDCFLTIEQDVRARS